LSFSKIRKYKDWCSHMRIGNGMNVTNWCLEMVAQISYDVAVVAKLSDY